MFVMLTLENFPDNVAMGQAVSQWTIVYFISYVLLASFLIFNLFIGIVLNSMEEARAADRKEHEKDDLLTGCAPRATALGTAERGTPEGASRRRLSRAQPSEFTPRHPGKALTSSIVEVLR